MKVWVSEDEWWPVYQIGKATKGIESDSHVEVSEELWDWVQRVFKEFDEVQEELKHLYGTTKQKQ